MEEYKLKSNEKQCDVLDCKDVRVKNFTQPKPKFCTFHSCTYKNTDGDSICAALRKSDSIKTCTYHTCKYLECTNPVEPAEPYSEYYKFYRHYPIYCKNHRDHDEFLKKTPISDKLLTATMYFLGCGVMCLIVSHMTF